MLFPIGSSSCPIRKNTSSNVEIETPYDKIFNSNNDKSNFWKKLANRSEYAYGILIVISDYISDCKTTSGPKF